MTANLVCWDMGPPAWYEPDLSCFVAERGLQEHVYYLPPLLALLGVTGKQVAQLLTVQGALTQIQQRAQHGSSQGGAGTPCDQPQQHCQVLTGTLAVYRSEASAGLLAGAVSGCRRARGGPGVLAPGGAWWGGPWCAYVGVGWCACPRAGLVCLHPCTGVASMSRPPASAAIICPLA